MEDVASAVGSKSRDRVGNSTPLTADALCTTYGDKVFKFAQLISDDSAGAEDLAQDALERAIRGLRTFDPAKGEIEAWLWRIVVNAARDAGRIARRQRLVFEMLVDRWRAEENAESFDLHVSDIDLLKAVRALPPRQRAVVGLHYGADLTHRSVGEALGITEAAALMTTRRALNVLRLRLSQREQAS